MKRNYLYALSAALLLAACSDHDVVSELAPADKPQIEIPADAVAGELLIKFAPEMSEILDRTQAATRATGGVATRSGIPSTDEVLSILGAYHFERVFPVDNRTEDKARRAGLHLWYQVKFDEGTDLREAYARISSLGEVSKLQANSHIYRAYKPARPARLLSDATLEAVSHTRSGRTTTFDDPRLQYQWHLINNGSTDICMENEEGKKNTWAQVDADCDLGAEEAWTKCTGNPEIIVAVLDEAVAYDHPDLIDNMWVNEGETFASNEDADGNGYKGDRHGFNFVKMTGNLSYSSNSDTGHGTHVAGIIAARNNNGIGIGSIAGGDGTPQSGVRIMSCQVFDGDYSVTIANEAKAMKYAADNGAVILQCSWGYNSSESNPLFYPFIGPATVEEWAELYPLEKEAIDYFVQNAGSPNGVIDGGLVVFAAGNESAGAPGFPGAYEKCISVGALAADFTPAVYSNFGKAVDLSAPGGDTDYYGYPGYTEQEEDQAQGGILSTVVTRGQMGYAYMEGTSMACPAVSGVAALGLSYALEQHRHFTAEEFKNLLVSSGHDLDTEFGNRYEKLYHFNHTALGSPATRMDLLQYVGKMGTMADAAALLNAIDGGAGSDMKIPNVYVAPEESESIDLSKYFKGEQTFSLVNVEDVNIAQVVIGGSQMTVTGVKTGSTRATIKAGSAEQTIVITVRRGTGNGGWM